MEVNIDKGRSSCGGGVSGGSASGGLGGFVARAQATRAEVDTGRFSGDSNRGRVDVRRPAAVGVTLGMADVVSELGRLTANITLQCTRLL